MSEGGYFIIMNVGVCSFFTKRQMNFEVLLKISFLLISERKIEDYHLVSLAVTEKISRVL